MDKIIVILGPTASGKTSLGIKIAKKFSGEIISTDSRQVYISLDLGSAKVKNFKPKDRTSFQKKMGYCKALGVPHWLIDVVDLEKETFSVGKFKKMADLIIKDILKRKKLPILVGGSMFYIDAVTKGMSFPPKSSIKIRKKLEEKTLKELKIFLKKIDPKAYKKVDLKNPRRISRAIEIKLETGKSILDFKKQDIKYEVLKLGVEMPRKKLYEKIDARVDERMRQGMLQEVKDLIKNGVPKEKLIALGLEYRFLTQYLIGEIPSLEEALSLLKGAIHRFVRRQLTWWRKDKEIIWIKNQKQAEKEIGKFIR